MAAVDCRAGLYTEDTRLKLGHIYIYIYRERDIDIDIDIDMYIYIYIYRERERCIHIYIYIRKATSAGPYSNSAELRALLTVMTLQHEP